MTRLLVVGNSHAGALRAALRDGRRGAVAVLAAPGDAVADLALDGRRLAAGTEAARAALIRVGGAAEADLAGFDAVAVVGCMMAPATAARVWRDMRWRGLPSLDASPDLATMAPALVPRAAAAAALRAHLDASLALRLARLLAPALPVVVASQPRPSDAVLDVPHPLALSAAACVRAGDADALSAFHEAVAAAACAAAGAAYVPQPPATRAHGMLTARAWMAGAPRLAAHPGARQPPDEPLHANAAYGALMLDAILAQPA